MAWCLLEMLRGRAGDNMYILWIMVDTFYMNQRERMCFVLVVPGICCSVHHVVFIYARYIYTHIIHHTLSHADC